MTRLFGIKNCDSCRAARRWLEAHHIEFAFHDLREQGLERAQLQQWVDELGCAKVLNKRSTTWKQLDPAQREGLDGAAAIELMLTHPTLIKRPVLDTGAQRHVGFKDAEYASLFQHHTL